MKSIIENLNGNNTFTRVRIGVGKILTDGKLYEPDAEKLSDFVLSNLNDSEISEIKTLAKEIVESL